MIFTALNKLHKNTLWLVQFIFIGCVCLLFASLAISIILSSIYPTTPDWIHDARCVMGYPSQEGGKKCIQDEIEKVKQSTERERQALLKRLEKSVADARLRERKYEIARAKVIAEGKEQRADLKKKHEAILTKRVEALEEAKRKVQLDGENKRLQMEQDHAAILAKRDLAISDAKDRELKLKAEQMKSAALVKRLSDLENKWTDFSLFSHKNYKNSQVTSGVRYTSLVKGTKHSNAWCYWEPNRKDIPVKYSLGTTGILWGINWQKYTDDQLQKGGVERYELEEAKKLCQWPQGVK